MDDCPYQYPIFMFIIWLYGSMFLVLFLHFWYHAYTKGQRLPKMARNGISKDQWNKLLSLKSKKSTCQRGNLHYLTIKRFRCAHYMVYILYVFFQNRICIFTVSYLGFRRWERGRTVDIWLKKKGRWYLSRKCIKIKIIGKTKMCMTSTEYFEHTLRGIKMTLL